MKKKYDPHMHSAEHILNQTMDRMFNCGRCFSAHIEKKKSKCDYRFDRPLLDADIRQIESQVNRVIQADMPVKEEWAPRHEAEKEFNLERLPQDTDQMIRIIKIGDYDACPCIGPHVTTTGEIGRFRITTTGFENGVLRIRYRLSTES
jgi:misacylated tRNA(Ala) deacylase